MHGHASGLQDLSSRAESAPFPYWVDTASPPCHTTAHSRILGVAQGSTVNQDGRSSSLTAPNGPSQRSLILDALQAAELEPERIAGIAVHGTGTPLGDPIGQPSPAVIPCLFIHRSGTAVTLPVSNTARHSLIQPSS